MDITKEYYLNKYDELSILSDTEKCTTSLLRNSDTGELVVKKRMHYKAFPIYNQLKEIKHNNIVNVLECFLDNDDCIEVEEYVNGKRIDDYCSSKMVESDECIKLIMDLCDGLDAIHKKGMVHRDIQPKNIIISHEGTLKLIDFDISRKTNNSEQRDTELLGTVGYAAPEQYGFKQTSNRSDIYSIGILIKEIFKQKYSQQTDKLERIISKCTEIDPQNRYPSVMELKNDLKKCIKSYAKYEEQSSIVEEEELPPITLKYVIGTIPGFKSKNPIFYVVAIFIYGILLYADGAAALDYETTSVIQKILIIIISEASLIIPYAYLTNIAHIAMRYPKKKYKNKMQQYAYQIIISFGIFMMFMICLAIVIPSKPQ